MFFKIKEAAEPATRHPAASGGCLWECNVEGICLAVLVFIKDPQLTHNSFFALKSVTVKFQGETLILLWPLTLPLPHKL